MVAISNPENGNKFHSQLNQITLRLSHCFIVALTGSHEMERSNIPYPHGRDNGTM